MREPLTSRVPWDKWRSGFLSRVLRFSLVLVLALVIDVASMPHRVESNLRSLVTQAPSSTAFMERAERDGRTVRRGAWTPMAELPPLLACAVVFGEDERFFDYGSFDWGRQLALARRLLQGDFSRGSSGISQQLVKNLYLSPDRSPRRKLKEYVLAYEMAHTLTKTRQLELYLNLVEWDGDAWGIARATRMYFGTTPAATTPTQAIILASVLPAPRQARKFGLSARGEARENRIAYNLWNARLLTNEELAAVRDRLTLWRASIARGRSRRDAWGDVVRIMGPERAASSPRIPDEKLPVARACSTDRRGV